MTPGVRADTHLGQNLAHYLKVELKRQKVTYEELARRVASLGGKETEASIASKLSRGTPTAAFLVLVLKAIDKKTTIDEIYNEISGFSHSEG